MWVPRERLVSQEWALPDPLGSLALMEPLGPRAKRVQEGPLALLELRAALVCLEVWDSLDSMERRGLQGRQEMQVHKVSQVHKEVKAQLDSQVT
jgi:hypothetical protein